MVEYLKKNLTRIENFNVLYLQEPVDTWTTVIDPVTNENIIEKYYSDQKKYSFSFQMVAYITRLSQIKEALKNAPENTIILTERCLHTDYNIFAKMLYDSGILEPIEYSIYCRWFYEFIGETDITGFIYLKTTPETCLQRINTRNRKGESVSLEYLQKCHNYHEKWLTKNVVVWDQPEQRSEEFLLKISQFIVDSLKNIKNNQK